ncbi:hypothetical protein [Streptomyces sp. NPDC021139]|uniref:hypothetical protein n=1 Tax=unclassified Streptomyces TaxID=2593676 RepID=UPI0033EEB399
MNDTIPTPEDRARAWEEEVTALLPALAALDKTATQLEAQTASGKEVTVGEVATYETQAAHVRHLVDAASVSTREITSAEAEHQSDGERGFASRGLDHATHTRHFEPSPAADASTDQEQEVEEEINL